MPYFHARLIFGWYLNDYSPLAIVFGLRIN